MGRSCIAQQCIGFLHWGKFMGQLCCSKNFYSKTSFFQFMQTVCQKCVHEAVTNPGTTIDQVAETALGAQNFTALNGKVAIVTGASNGLGLENARVLQKYGCHVVWAVRNVKKAQKRLEELKAREGNMTGKVTVLQVDLSDLTTVKPFVDSFLRLNIPLHVLMLNAGIMAPPKWEPSKQGIESMFAINNLSHFLMTELLMPKIEQTAEAEDVRIVILTSGAGCACSSIDLSKCPVSKEEYHDFGDYSVTKAIDTFHARHLQKKYEGTNIHACAVHPGYTNTGILDHNDSFGAAIFHSCVFAPFLRSLAQCSATSLYCALSKDIPKLVADGHFYYYNCAPQSIIGICRPGAADHLVGDCEARQRELVEPYM